jgi:hypothetical protein
MKSFGNTKNSNLIIQINISFNRTWDYVKSDRPQETIQHHTEFVVGLDFNLHQPSEVWLTNAIHTLLAWWYQAFKRMHIRVRSFKISSRI